VQSQVTDPELGTQLVSHFLGKLCLAGFCLSIADMEEKKKE